MGRDEQVNGAYELAKARYAELGVDTDKAIAAMNKVPVSVHCWQGDDVAGFENPGAGLDGGIQATGNYPGKARNPQELRADLEKSLTLCPGAHRVNVHAIYLETGGKRVERDEIGPEHFANWIDWAKQHKLGLDFNGSFFSHPKASDGFTLAHADSGIRKFWVRHGQASRRIGAAMGKALGSPCVTNVWIPDGYKDVPADRLAPRKRLGESLDELFAEKIDKKHLLDAVECKLFGIGSESYVVGSHEFYMGYAVKKNLLLCLDSGHFHPTETVSDKISSCLLHVDGLLLHVSRGVRWDSDHVVTLSEELTEIMREIVRCDATERVHIGLDYFDASINRVAAWTIGIRNARKAILSAFLDPAAAKQAERAGDLTGRLAYLEEAKTLPMAAVWDYACLSAGIPVGAAWLDEVRAYETAVLSKRK